MTDAASAYSPSRFLGLHSSQDLARLGVVIALIALVLFGAPAMTTSCRAQHPDFLRYNSMFALIALGMCFVIITGGIDLSVGGVAAMASVVAAHVSPYGLVAGALAGTLAGLLVGLLNGLIITRLKILPFITTLATMLAAYGTALLLSNNQSVSVSYDSGFTEFGQGDFLASRSPPGSHWLPTLAGGSCWSNGPKASYPGNRRRRGCIAADGPRGRSPSPWRLRGLWALAGLAGVILASQFGAGQPTEGIGWELFAIASVVVGGTLLSGGSGSVGATLAGALLLAMIFNLLNFENGLGWISLSAYWQSVIRGLFLFVVIILQAKIAKTAQAA